MPNPIYQSLHYRPNVIDSVWCDDILREVDTEDRFWSRQNGNLIHSYGFEYRTDGPTTSQDSIGALIAWVATVSLYLYGYPLVRIEPNQATVYNIESGQGIRPILENRVSIENDIAILCLGYPIPIVLTNVSDDQAPIGKKLRTMLQPGSVFVIQDRVRFGWTWEVEAKEIDEWQDQKITRRRVALAVFRYVIDDFRQVDDELIFDMRARGGKVYADPS